MDRGLSFNVDGSPGQVAVQFFGRLSEYAELDELTSELPPDCSLVLDVGGIARLNSIGVRKWIEFMEQCRRTLRNDRDPQLQRGLRLAAQHRLRFCLRARRSPRSMPRTSASTAAPRKTSSST